MCTQGINTTNMSEGGEINMQMLYNEIADIRKDQAEFKESLMAKIDEVCKTIRTDINRVIDTKIQILADEMKAEFGRCDKRITEVES